MARLGTGVVVWSGSEDLPNGSIVWVWDQSRIRKTVIIQRPDGGSRFEADSWRVRLFSDEAKAQTFAQAFTAWKDIWGVNQKSGLAVRSQPDASADLVYKLANDEEVKILNQQDNVVRDGGFEGHWVQILTQSGYVGWCFDYYLSLYKVKGTVKTRLKQGGPGDFYLRTVEGGPWYPEEFRNEIEQGRINLDYFRPDYSFQFDGATAFQLTIPPPPGSSKQAEEFSFPFSEVRKIDAATFLFVGQNNLTVRILNPEVNKIEVKFQTGDQQRSFLYVRLDRDVGTYTSQEAASRVEKLNEILAHGKTLVSPTFGRLTMAPDGSFVWLDFESLQPPLGTLLPKDISGKGRFIFDWFKDRQMVGDWRVLRMELDIDSAQPFSQLFLYRFLKGGFQMLPVSNADIDPVRRTVLRESRAGFTLFFNFQS